MFTTFIFPLFSVIISSSLLINDEPQGPFKSTIFSKLKFFANERFVKSKNKDTERK